jgi:hypothetical protein
MKNLILLTVSIAIALSFYHRYSPPTWELDQRILIFEPHTHLMVSDIRDVESKEATLNTPKTDFTDATIYLVADMSSIDTDNDGGMIISSADFFNAKNFLT